MTKDKHIIARAVALALCIACGGAGPATRAKVPGVADIQDFGATGDGLTDDAPAIQAAHDSLPPRGGIIVVPGVTASYRLLHTVTLTKPVILEGDGRVELTKGATLDGPALVLAGPGITVRDLHVGGEPGNGGDGIVLQHKNQTLENVQVYLQGRDGIRIGVDGVVPFIPGAQAEGWYLQHTWASYNGRHGLYLHDAVNTPTQAYNGTADFLGAVGNGADGVRLDSTVKNVFTGGSIKKNGGYGMNFGPGLARPLAMNDFVIGGSFEQNAQGSVHVAADACDLTLDLPTDATVSDDSSACEDGD